MSMSGKQIGSVVGVIAAIAIALTALLTDLTNLTEASQKLWHTLWSSPSSVVSPPVSTKSFITAAPNTSETTAVENLNVPSEKPNEILLGSKKTKEWAIVYQELGHAARSSELATQGRTYLDDAYNGLVQEGLNDVAIFTNNTLDFVLIHGFETRLEALSHLDEFRNKRTSLGYPGNVGVISLRSICPSGVFVPNNIGDYVCS